LPPAAAAVGAIIREGTQKLTGVITSGAALGMQFMDQAIHKNLQAGIATPFEAYMKSIDKSRFKKYLPGEIRSQLEG
jgi:twitching motility protein PilT